MPEANVFTLPFLTVCCTIAVSLIVAWQYRQQLWGIPAAAVLLTVFVWYGIDPIYNDYESYLSKFGDGVIEDAWWQVCLFAVAFMAFSPPVAKMIAGPAIKSHAVELLESQPIEQAWFQKQVDLFFRPLLIAWILLMLVALVRANFDFAGLFAPYLGRRVNPWSRGRIGGGFDSILSLAAYFQIFLTAGFGVVFAVSKNPRTRLIAMVVCCLALPFFFVDRTRNTMLSVAIPGFLAWVFGRVKGTLLVKILWLTAGFFLLSFWFAFVLGNRTGGSIAQALTQQNSFELASKTKHLGLNMFEELCWINHFMEDRTYVPNNGARYFAELVNPVPRSLWPNKPMIGIDYAIARGQEGGSSQSAGVFATISTGMIGQGIVNFGPVFGPVAAALLMACWVGILARQDRFGHSPARLLVYALGMILTFNLGRDITLLTLYPFFFGLAMVVFWERRQKR